MSIFRFPIRTTALLFLLAAGCIRVDLPEQQVRETHTYDLRPLPQEERGFPCKVEILPFFSDAPARYKMLYRKGTELRVEEYRKWGQSPAAMLTRLFRSAFVPSKVTEEEYRLSGTILQFEANEETNTADLTVKYVFSTLRNEDPVFVRTLTVSEKRKDGSPEAFAEAMSLAARRQIREIKQLIQQEIKPK